MQLRFQQRTVNVLASQDPFIEDAVFERFLQYLGDSFEMLANFIVDAALRVAAVVSGIAVTAALARERLKQTFAFGQFPQAKIEHASPVPVDQYDAEAWGRTQQMGQRLQMKMPVDHQFGARQLRGQIIFPPEILPGASEHGLRVGAIAAQFVR